VHKDAPRRLRLLAPVGLAAIVLAACSGSPTPLAGSHPPTTRKTTTTTTTTPVVATSTSTVPVTPIAWSSCGSDLQCGTLTVPLDYADPSGPTIGMAVERHLAEVPADRIGSLVIDPGGPGVSGIDDMSNELSVLTSGLLDDFDIVTFDPRGVQRSDPVNCGNSGGAPTSTLPDPIPQTTAAKQALLSNNRSFGQQCQKDSGAILSQVGTVDVARDMERLRIALGDSALTYMGQSYGTLIGLMYAQLYPTHIRAMVLDSVIDPSLTLSQMTLGQAEGFESTLGSFFTWCSGSSACPWAEGSDPTSTLLALIAKSRTDAAPGPGQEAAGPGEIYDALLEGLYAPTDYATLGDALAQDAAGQGDGVVAMADHYAQDGSSNGSDAAEAIDCADHPAPSGLSAYNALAFEFSAEAPVFGPLLSWGEAACSVWPVPPSREPANVTAPGSPPILVIGTTQDPATPYAWAVHVAKELSHGVLLTHDGDDHVSYFYSACVRADAQTYLVNLSTPPVGRVCTS
jgi:pimeloyl-ACP methyl ester carboxylesterase